MIDKRSLLMIILLPLSAWAATAFDLPIGASYYENNDRTNFDSLYIWWHWQGSLEDSAITLDYAQFDTVISVDSLGVYHVRLEYVGTIGRSAEDFYLQSGYRNQYDSMTYAYFISGSNEDEFKAAERFTADGADTIVEVAQKHHAQLTGDSLATLMGDVDGVKTNTDKFDFDGDDSLRVEISNAFSWVFDVSSDVAACTLFGGEYTQIADTIGEMSSPWTAAEQESVSVWAEEIVDSVRDQSWAATGASGSGAYTVTYYARDTVNDVMVYPAILTFLDTLETTISAGPITTNTSGYVTINLDNDYYAVTANANNVTFSTDTFAVDGATTDTIKGIGVTTTAQENPAYCVVEGYLLGSGYEYGGNEEKAANWDVRFELREYTGNNADTAANKVIVAAVVNTATDSAGYLRVNLLKTANMLYKSGGQTLEPTWSMTASPTDVVNDPRCEVTFKIPADSTNINIGLLLE